MRLRRSLPRAALLAGYDALICDLDGVVHRGGVAVPAAVGTLNSALRARRRLTFATNNASRPPEAVADHLRSLGLERSGWSVVTSAQAAAHHLRDALGTGARVVAVGGPGVTAALTAAGLVPVRVDAADASAAGALVQGLGPDVSWTELAAASVLVREGMPWVVTNTDLLLPGARGPLPGNGTLVEVVRTASGVEPSAMGKPGRAMFELARGAMGTSRRRTLVCGDRLDTDIAGAVAAGLDSVLVLSGVSSLRDLALAAPAQRPRFAAPDLGGLLAVPHPLLPGRSGLAVVSRGGLPEPVPSADPQRRLASVVALAWWVLDAGGELCRDPDAWEELERRVSPPRAASAAG